MPRESDPKPLANYLPALLRNRNVKRALRQEFGTATPTVVGALLAGQASAQTLLAQDLIADLARNTSSTKRTLYGLGTCGAFPIQVKQFGPIFWIWPQEFDWVGYFPSFNAACAYAETEWQPFISALNEEGDPDDSEDDSTHEDEAAERQRLESGKSDQEAVEAIGLTHLVQHAMRAYEELNPDRLYKTYVTGMAHEHRKRLFATRVRSFVALHRSLPPTETIEEWVRKDIPLSHRQNEHPM